MKRFFTLLAICAFITLSATAQSFKAYIAVNYNSVQRAAIVNVGDEMIVLRDEKGQLLQFNTVVAVFNYLGKKGWTLVPIDMERSNTQAGAQYLFTKTVSSMEAIKREFVPAAKSSGGK